MIVLVADHSADFGYAYIIIREKERGYDVEEILVPFNRELMLKSIDDCTMPYKNVINTYVSR